ncbi:serine protease [Aquipuribacter sp. SD81]|uniref:serine protease n=1 Tax=Aquipuribacter sp. SD81 TaxID=3127703 RepID=UPI0030192C23
MQNVLCDGVATGSGAVVGTDLVVTAAHVVAGHATLQLLLGEQTATAEVVGYDEGNDIALLRSSQPLSGHRFEIAQVPADIGTEVAAIGYPLSGALSLAGPGIVSAYGEQVQYRWYDGSTVEVYDLMRMTVPTNSGNSGGPVVDADGVIVGLVSGTRSSLGEVVGEDVVVDVVEGFKFAVPARVVADRMEQWADEAEPLEPQVCEATDESDQGTVVTTQVDSVQADVVADVLFDYFDGITTGDYERAYAQLSEDRRSSLSLEQFRQEQATSYVYTVVVMDASADGDDIRAQVTFTSTQDPAFGPDNLPCVTWLLDYRLVPGGEHGWSIQESGAVDGQPRYEPCTSESDV